MIVDLPPHLDSAVADFWVRAWAQTLPNIDFDARRPWIIEHIHDMRAGQQVVRAFVRDDEALAFYSLFPATGLLEQICVNPDAAGQGIGAALIADAGLLAQQPLNLVVNADNGGARHFYAKLGFIDGAHFKNPMSGLPVIAMVKG